MVVVLETMVEAVTVTALVAVMMIAVEYVNVATRGLVMGALGRSRLQQYLLAAALGAIPGCLGAFALAALYSHRRISLGAVVAGMIATSGDEAFVMLAMFPLTAVLLSVGLAVFGVACGWATDRIAPRRAERDDGGECDFDVHSDGECSCAPEQSFLLHWRPPSAHRLTLAAAMGALLFALALGLLGPESAGWRRTALTLVPAFGLAVVVTVPDHFLEEHLWQHVVRTHLPRLFLWTAGALVAIALAEVHFDLGAMAGGNRWLLLLVAAGLGLVPESGPHMVFVALFATGSVPLSVLVASSVAQDGHGMLPVLAHSRRDFLVIKAINLAAGLLAGGALMELGL